MLQNLRLNDKEVLKRYMIEALSLFQNRAVEQGEGAHQRVQVIEITEPSVFNLIFRNLECTDLKSLRSVCKQLNEIFEFLRINKNESPISQFWERSIVRFRTDDLRVLNQYKFNFSLQYGLNLTLSLSTELSRALISDSKFWELMTSFKDSLGTNANEDFAQKMQRIKTLEVRSCKEGTDMGRLENIFTLIDLNKNSFSNLTCLICACADFSTFKIPASIEHFESNCVYSRDAITLCNSTNLKSITLYKVEETCVVELENLPNLESLEIWELKHDITLDIQTLPKLTNIKINEKVISCDRSREKMVIESDIIQAVLPKVA